ncbi:MAG TPA: VOC family protein [Terriglobales bacterium]|nr:VOC family protein [Terriglobales bacterium]
MPNPPITALVPMVHVADVERSVAFYQLLGFEVGNRVPPTGPMGWCWLYQPHAPDWKRGANLMLSRSECPIDAKVQSFLVYLYAEDLAALRTELLAHGLKPSEITFPIYLPEGEFQLSDPDGFCLMIAQSAPDTP